MPKTQPCFGLRLQNEAVSVLMIFYCTYIGSTKVETFATFRANRVKMYLGKIVKKNLVCRPPFSVGLSEVHNFCYVDWEE